MCRLGEGMLETKTSIADELVPPGATDRHGVRTAVAWSGLLFAMLQSVCTFFAALDGLRLGIGLSSLALAAGTAAAIDRFHVDWLRVPMIGLAIVGSVLNLVVLGQIWRLRRRKAAHWRRAAPKRGRLVGERVQFALSVVTLVLVIVEERQHLIWLHHL